MHNGSHSTIRRVLSGSSLVLAGSLALAACGGGAGATTVPATQGAAATTAPATAAAASTAPSVAPGTPGPTPLALMPIGMLPQAEVPKNVKVSCEDASGATLSCDDAVSLAARMAITTSGAAPIEQVLVDRTDPNVVKVTFWAKDAETGELTAYSASVDAAAQTMSFPAEDAEAVFPS